MRVSSLRAIIFVILATLLAYANSLPNDFVWDDETLIKDNSHIRNATYFATIFTSDLAHQSHAGTAYYRPLQTVTYWMDYQLWGLNPTGYHLTNLLLHALSAVLVFFTVRHFTDQPVVPLAVALLFAVHPLNTSAVTYIAGRADSLALAGMLGAFLLHQHYRAAPGRSVLYFIAALLGYVAALFSRESAMLFPALLLVAGGRPYRRAVPFLILLGAFLLWRHAVIQLLDKPLVAPWDVSLAQRLEIFCRSIATYLSLLFWPVHLQMDRSVVHASHGLTLAGILGLLALGAAYRLGNRSVRLGLAWFAVALLPMTGLLNLVATVAEHWLYVPMIGFYFALASLVPWRKTTGCAAVLILVALTGRTAVRNRDWADGATLFARQTQSAAPSERAFTNLGHTQFAAGDTAAGLATLRRAEELNPRSTTAKFNLAVVHLKRGENDLAREKLEECAALDPTDETLWELVAQIHDAQGHVALATRYYRQALTCTREVGVRLRYARFLVRHSRSREAFAILEESLYLEPGHAGVFRFLAELLAHIGDHHRAAQARHLAASLDRHS